MLWIEIKDGTESKKHIELWFIGEGIMSEDPGAAVEESYRQEVFDEFVVPTVITSSRKTYFYNRRQ